MRNEQIAQYWKEGKKAKSNNGNMHTDGLNIWSYDLLIGVTLSNGEKVGMSRVSISMTTYRHLTEMHKVADRLVQPVYHPYYSHFYRWQLPIGLESESEVLQNQLAL